MEVIRNIKPIDNFLIKVRRLANKYKAILIFDECTTGFRETLGGIHKKYKVNPDMAIFGKALGNGYAITAVIGKKKNYGCSRKLFYFQYFLDRAIRIYSCNKNFRNNEKDKLKKINY